MRPISLFVFHCISPLVLETFLSNGTNFQNYSLVINFGVMFSELCLRRRRIETIGVTGSGSGFGDRASHVQHDGHEPLTAAMTFKQALSGNLSPPPSLHYYSPIEETKLDKPKRSSDAMEKPTITIPLENPKPS